MPDKCQRNSSQTISTRITRGCAASGSGTGVQGRTRGEPFADTHVYRHLEWQGSPHPAHHDAYRRAQPPRNRLQPRRPKPEDLTVPQVVAWDDWCTCFDGGADEALPAQATTWRIRATPLPCSAPRHQPLPPRSQAVCVAGKVRRCNVQHGVTCPGNTQQCTGAGGLLRVAAAPPTQNDLFIFLLRKEHLCNASGCDRDTAFLQCTRWLAVGADI